MASIATFSEASAGAGRKVALVVIGLVALWFVYDGVLGYFAWNEAAYGYYWPFRVPLLVHIAGGLVALLAGVWQLWSGFGRQGMQVHPLTGRLYAAGVLIGSAGAFYLAVTSGVFGFAWSVGLFGLGIAWFATTGMALYCVRRRNIRLHQQWMVRSYIVTFGFVTFRIISDYVPYEAWWGISQPDMSTASIWAVWALPLLGYELLLAARSQRSA